MTRYALAQTAKCFQKQRNVKQAPEVYPLLASTTVSSNIIIEHRVPSHNVASKFSASVLVCLSTKCYV